MITETEKAVGNGSQTSYQLACMEVWGGHRKVARHVELPGLAGWVYSNPLDGAPAGGDVYYLSVCNRGLLSRVALADVSGHGQAISSVAALLHTLMHKHINTWDQTAFMRELNRAFQQGKIGQYATAAVLGFYQSIEQLVYTNAGHLSPLWYHRRERKWGLLEEDTAYAQTALADLPVGVISGTVYHQTVVQLSPGDMLVLYSDGVTEAVNDGGQELSRQRLLEVSGVLPVEAPAATGEALIAAVQAFRRGVPASDDETIVVLQCRAGLNAV